MADQSVTAGAGENTETFEQPVVEFVVMVPETQADHALILPVGDGVDLTKYTKCYPGKGVPFRGKRFTGFKHKRSGASDTTVDYYLTSFVQ
jgi:hypothetical protein